MDFRLFRKILEGGSNSKTYIKKVGGRLIVRKEISKKQDSKLKSQVRWIIKNHGPHVPFIISHGYTLKKYYYDMPYYKDYINFKNYIQKEPIQNSSNIIDMLLKFLFNEVYFYTKEDKAKIELKLNLYLNKKLYEKIKEVVQLNPVIRTLVKTPFIYINNKKYKNIPLILKDLKDSRSYIVRHSKKMVTNLHGDVTVENILCNEDSFIILDPNDENSFNSHLVDMGKLFQSLHSNYEFLKLIKNCNVEKNSISYLEPKNEKYMELYSALSKKLDTYLSNDEKKLVLFHEAMHYARMLPYKQKINKSTVPVYYAIMIKRFNDFLENDKTNNL